MYGLFAAMTPAGENIVPGAFFRYPGRTDSPFPVQVRFNIVLECPPVHDSDKDLRSIFFNKPIGVGPIPLKETKQLANLFAARAGAFPPPMASDSSRIMPMTQPMPSPSGQMHPKGDGNYYRPPHKFVERNVSIIHYFLLLYFSCSGLHQYCWESF